MADLFASGRVVDLILVLLLLEAGLLAAAARLTRRSPRFAAMLGNLLAGAFLLLAVRAALVDAAWGWTAACLAAALGAHLLDLHGRFRQS